MPKYIYILFFVLSNFSLIWGQNSRTSAEIMEDLHKLKVLGSVLYIAAHPDDENTRLITYLSKGKHLRTAYMSLTRGDGGQNLIGDELDEYLGVIRTQELVEARKIDGGIQYFSRANDFGYSKNAEETFAIWNKDSILSDVLRLVREFKPDVVINRFDHRTSGRTHGHHTASAMLGLDAFKYCNSPLFMRDVMKGTDAHMVQRIFFNTSYFFYGREKFDTMDKSFLYQLDVGDFYPALGLSNNEIASQSRSMHKSQGFGINSSRGFMPEYFERLGAPKDKDHMSPFDGLDLSWTRINGGGNVDQVLDEIIQKYDYQKPWKSIELLQKAEKYMEDLPNHDWKDIKLKEIRSLIADCAGIFAEASTDQQIICEGAMLKMNVEFIIRNPIIAELIQIQIPSLSFDSAVQLQVMTNKSYTFQKSLKLVNGFTNTAPFWLLNGRPNSAYQTGNVPYKLLPTAPRDLKITFKIKIAQKEYTLIRDIIYKNDDPVLGEVKENLDILPPSLILADDPIYLIQEKTAKCTLRFISNAANQDVSVSLQLPTGFKSSIGNANMHFEKAGEIKALIFDIFSNSQQSLRIEIPVFINGKQGFFYKPIKYPHIQKQNVLTPAKIILLQTNMVSHPKKIAYVDGAGDFIDEAMLKLGHKVDHLSAAALDQLDIHKHDVLVFGIRALNNREELKHCKKYILPFIEHGGKVVMQYNTTADLMTPDFAPSEIKIGRGRVTDESAHVTFLKPEHPVLNDPNSIDSLDFENWVQERGLYFPSNYDSSYDEILAMNDPGENPLKSALLVKKYGKGYFVYTSLAFFRQLKAGVPGAYKLFDNIISFR
ncbi:MAG: PIG-L family deacetylase [Saprospiraceae bacterium]|nr:PIG-L family deacetylase [Saprospiraceae bacterium]